MKNDAIYSCLLHLPVSIVFSVSLLFFFASPLFFFTCPFYFPDNFFRFLANSRFLANFCFPACSQLYSSVFSYFFAAACFFGRSLFETCCQSSYFCCFFSLLGEHLPTLSAVLHPLNYFSSLSGECLP